MQDTELKIKELTGSWLVFPGHPLVIATTIMDTFASYAEADAHSDNGAYNNALADARILGAGDHVTAAMRTLALGERGESVEQMVSYANHYWTSGNAGGHHGNVASGSEQARLIEPTFSTLAEKWFAKA